MYLTMARIICTWCRPFATTFWQRGIRAVVPFYWGRCWVQHLEGFPQHGRIKWILSCWQECKRQHIRLPKVQYPLPQHRECDYNIYYPPTRLSTVPVVPQCVESKSSTCVSRTRARTVQFGARGVRSLYYCS